MFLDNLLGGLGIFARRIKTASVVAPLLVLILIVGLLALPAALLAPRGLATLFVIAFLASVVFFMGAYVYFALQAPDRLQTEEYQLEHRKLLLIGDERSPNDPKLIEGTATANTAVTRNTSGGAQ